MGNQLPKRGQAPYFSAHVLWTNGCMDQDATWYGGRPRSRPHCVRWRRSPPKGQTPQFSAHVCCGQTAGWIQMPLATEVDFGPGHIVLDGDPASTPKGAQQPHPSFRPMSIVAKQSPISATAEHLLLIKFMVVDPYRMKTDSID